LQSEQAEVKLALQLLQSPYLEKKIKGINEMKDFIARSEPAPTNYFPGP
jgi:hypothetical protein